MTRPIQHTIEHVGLDEILTGLRKSDYDESSQSLTDRPVARFTIDNPGGVMAHVLAEGDEIYVRRNRERRFHGIISLMEPRDSDDGSWIKCEAVQLGYKLLQARQCDSYDFDEDGDPATTRDAVTINPWRYFIFRDPDGALDANGNGPALDGVTFDDVFKCLIGTKFIHQFTFLDNKYLLASQAFDNTKTVEVYRDGAAGDTRPSLQRVRAGENFAAGDSIETVPLMSGDPNIDVMGDVSTVDITIVGDYDGTNDVQAEVCRNAGEGTRTYTSVSLTRQSGWNGSNFDAWTGTVDLSSDGATQKNQIGIKFTIPGNAGDTSTTSIDYVKVEAVTTSDTGITEGTIDAYSNPVAFGDGGEDFCETDLLTLNRLEASERVRTLTESDSTVNTSPHWDAWIDHNEQFYFQERRGTDLAEIQYDDSEGLLEEISHEFYYDELAYQTIAYGAGSGVAQTRIVSKQEFSGGGLYDSDRDPAQGAKKIYQVRKFVDPNETSATNLLRKARAFHKLHRDPIESFKIRLDAEYVPYFNVGDGIKVKNLKTRTNDHLRVVKINRSWTAGQGERLNLKIGEPLIEFTKRLVSNEEQNNIVVSRPQPAPQRLGLSGNGITFDKNTVAPFTFTIPNGRLVDRVFLDFRTVPFQSNTKSSASASPAESVNLDRISYDSGASQDVGAIPRFVNAEIAAANDPPYGGGSVAGTIRQDLGTPYTYHGHLLVSSNPFTGPTLTSMPGYDPSNRALTSISDGVGNRAEATVIDADYGIGYNCTTQQGFESTDSTFDIQGNLSLVLILQNVSTSENNIISSADGSNGTGEASFRLKFNASNQIQYEHYNGTSTETFTGSTTFSATESEMRIYVIRNVSTKSIKVVVNGTTEIDTTYTTDPNVAGWERLRILAHGSGNSVAADLFQCRISTAVETEADLAAVADPNDANHLDFVHSYVGSEVGLWFFEPAALDMVSLAQATAVTLQDDESFTLNGDFEATDASEGGEVCFTVCGGDAPDQLAGGGERAYQLVMVQTAGSHEHPLTFGIFQFDGDNGDGTGDPVYAEGVEFAVDPTIDGGTGLPSNFNADKHPASFGKESNSVNQQFDVTGYLNTTSESVIEDGPHEVWLRGAASALNADGLGSVIISPDIKYREDRE